jgi:predicted amidophosphoribosyltransferase
VQGLYYVKEGFEDQVNNKRALLVDDVMTTGSTCSKCAEWLKEEGASRVDVFVAGRTIFSARMTDR